MTQVANFRFIQDAASYTDQKLIYNKQRLNMKYKQHFEENPLFTAQYRFWNIPGIQRI